MVREALSNISRHSNATEASLSVLEHPGFYQVIIRDNGTQAAAAGSGGIGLMNMRERVEDLHGIFRTEVQNGFRIFISIPKQGHTMKIRCEVLFMRIIIVDDDPFVCISLKTILQAEPGIEVCASGSSGEEAVRLYEEIQPDILLMDIQREAAPGWTPAQRYWKSTRMPGFFF